jgi:hypothetical protein
VYTRLSRQVLQVQRQERQQPHSISWSLHDNIDHIKGNIEASEPFTVTAAYQESQRFVIERDGKYDITFFYLPLPSPSHLPCHRFLLLPFSKSRLLREGPGRARGFFSSLVTPGRSLQSIAGSRRWSGYALKVYRLSPVARRSGIAQGFARATTSVHQPLKRQIPRVKT